MPGRASGSRPIRIVGLLVAVVAVVGTVFFGWEWGDTNGLLPVILGASAAVLAVGWTLYARFG